MSSVLALPQAEAIINEVRSHGTEIAMPDDDGKKIQVANELVEQAKVAQEAGAKGGMVVSVLAIAHAPIPSSPVMKESAESPEGPVLAERAARNEVSDEQESTEAHERPIRERIMEARIKSGSLDAAYEQKELGLARVKKENLPIPPDIEGDPPSLPRDISVLGDPEIRRLHSEFNACHARANWLVAVEQADLDAAKHIAEHRFNKRIGALDKIDKETKKAKTIPVLAAEANEDPEVLKWKEKEQEHTSTIRFYKALRDIYNSNCDRISREWTMRSAEREHLAR